MTTTRSLLAALGFGAAAGAAGTTALNAATYVDMVVRGRPASDTPQQLVDAVASRIGVEIPGGKEDRDNRLQGLGPLSGSLVGVTVGAVASAAHRFLRKHDRQVPAVVAVPVIAAAAMAMSDGPLKVFGVSDPATWQLTDWVLDAIPHLAYGVATYATITAADV